MNEYFDVIAKVFPTHTYLCIECTLVHMWTLLKADGNDMAKGHNYLFIVW